MLTIRTMSICFEYLPYSREQFEMSSDSRSIKIAFAMSVVAKVGEFLNTLTMQYELRYKW